MRGDDEMTARARAAPRVFCVEQGVPEREELDGRDGEGMHLVAVAGDRAARRPAGCCSSGRRSSSAASRSGPAPGAMGSPRAAGACRRRDPRRRCPPARAARPDLRPLAVRGGRLRAARAAVHGGRDRAHRDGEVPARPHARAADRPADRAARDHRRRAGWPAGRRAPAPTPPADVDPEHDPFADGHEDRTPPELYAVRPGGGPAEQSGLARAGGAEPVPGARAATRPSPRRTPTRTCSGPARRAARTR